MKSKVVVKGHPLHPMLIPFPFAFLTGAVGFDALGWFLADPSFWTTGRYLIAAGLVSGLVAALPGLVDYATVVPPRSSGKRRATFHLLANAGALALFAIGWALRPAAVTEASAGLLAIEAAGLALLCTGGWMGGTLVYRNQIAVDHRYAEAGKWQETRLDGAEGRDGIAVGRRDDLEVNQLKLLHVNGRRIVLGRTEDGYAAFDDACTHRGGSLADGVMICGTVQCPWHGSQFDVGSGAVKAGPAKRPIVAYRVSEEGKELRLHLTATRPRRARASGE